MVRIRKLLTKEMLTEQLNQVLLSRDEENVALSRSNVSKSNTEEMKKRQRKRKRDCEEMREEKKMELEWKPEDCAQPLGDVSKVTGKGEKKESHFKTFMFHGKQYGLVSFLLGFDLLIYYLF